MIPVAALGGAIAGGLTGVPGEKVEEAKASIKTAISDLNIQETLQDQIMENVREKTPHPLVRVEGQGPVSPGEKVSYQSLSGDLDSILEIGVTSCNLEEMGVFGVVTYTGEETIRANTKLEDALGRSYAPLAEDKVDVNTKNFMQMMKPLLVNMLGPMGKNIHFILFQSKDRDGKPIADATKEGSFKVIVGSKEFKFRLPLGSVLPAKYDPKTGENFPGNYNYNPFTGSKLGD